MNKELMDQAGFTEVWDYWDTRVFEGTLKQCEEYVADNEGVEL